ncbi:hypothetical protein RHSIM_Rhsim05G0019200 [Rhododendron simsii]|uniref:LOB domain-containing protein n=1 Tax=Rhododendron simsii TaxID=118357 RepID=A0A834LPQ3_RHOSS|nr:hypothetical protein RHSIM_Rhsim05G0019200 [Rhododendron simsii]
MEGVQNVANDANLHACAACKHQRKRCDSDVCPLARYFPADKSEEFQNVHRIYSVNNLIRILHSVPEHLRHETVETLILEATMRKEFPTRDANLVSDAITGENNHESSGEDSGEFESLDLQRLDELIDSYHAFTNFGVLAEPRSEARGKEPTREGGN